MSSFTNAEDIDANVESSKLNKFQPLLFGLMQYLPDDCLNVILMSKIYVL